MKTMGLYLQHQSTLASLTKDFLARHFHNRNYPIISIFFVKRITQNEIGVLEDFLRGLYLSLGQWETHQDEALETLYEKYTQARFEVAGGTRAQQRLLLIRNAVHGRLRDVKERSKRAFVILDGIDCCEPSLKLLLNLELMQLNNFNVNVLLTSRTAVFEHVQTFCDQDTRDESGSDDGNDNVFPQIEHTNGSLELFFTCRRCDHVLCFPCKEAGLTCKSWCVSSAELVSKT
jgi:hypothetical protein